MSTVFAAFGLLAIIVSLLPSVLCLVFIWVASNNNRSYKPFSASERKQTFFEIFAIAIVGPVLLFCLMFAMAAVPYLAIIGVLLISLSVIDAQSTSGCHLLVLVYRMRIKKSSQNASGSQGGRGFRLSFRERLDWLIFRQWASVPQSQKIRWVITIPTGREINGQAL